MSTLTSDVKEPAVNVDLPEEEEVDSQHGSGTPKSYKSSLNLQPEPSSDSELPNHRLGLHKTVSSPKFTPGHDPEFDEINTRLKSLTQHAHSFHDLPVTSIPTPPGFDEPAFEEPWMKNLDDTEINSMFKSLDLKARKNSKHEGINGVRRWTTEVPSMDPTGKDGKIPSNNFVPSSQPFPDFGGNSTTAKLDSGLLGLDSGSRSFSRHNSGSSVRSPLLERSPAAEHKPHTIPDLPRLPTTPVMGDQYMEIHRLKTEEQMLEERIRQLQMRRQQIGFAPPQAQNQNQSQNGYPSSEYDPWESAYINNYMTTLNPPIPYGHNSLLNNPDIMNTMQNQSLAAAVLSKRIRNNQSQPYAATPTAKPTATTGPVGANLFVFNFPRHFTDQDLCREFTPFGNVLSATVFIDKATGRSKCFGFVSFDNVESAQKAIQTLNGCMMGGKNIKVQLKRESSGAGSGQGGGQGGMSGGVYNGGYGQPQQQPHQAYNQGYGGQNNMYGYGFEK